MNKTKTIVLALLLASIGWRVNAQTTEAQSFASVNKPVPDGSASGVSDVRTFSSTIVNISNVKVKLHVAGEFNGDLYGYLRHITPTSTNICVLLNRPGRTSSDSAGYDDAGFDITFDDSASGDVHLYRSATTPTAGSPLTGSWKSDGRNVDPAAVTDATSRTATLEAFSGMNASGEWTLYLADLESGGTNFLVSWELDITGAQRPVITWSTPADIVYGTALGGAQLNASADVAGTFAYSPAAGTVLHAGAAQTLSVTFTPTDTAGYIPVTTNVAINVTKAPLTIAAQNTNKVYGAAVPTFTATYGGLVNGDASSVLDTPITLTTTATASSPAGEYPITSSTTPADADYAITFVAAILTNTPAPLTITANDATKVYGAGLPTFSASYSGFVNNDTEGGLSPGVSFGTAASSSSAVGTYAITPSGAVNPNYAITFVPGTLSVTRKSLTITAEDKTKLFGEALPTFTAGYAGFVNNDNAAGLATPVTFSTSALATSAVGTYTITPAGATSPNYTIAFANGTLTINAASTIASVSSSVNPSLPGQAVTFTFTASAVAPGAGTPTGTAVFKFDGAGTGTSVALSGGTAALSKSDLTHGTHTLVVEYAGDGNFTGSSATLSPVQNVNTPPVAGADTIERWATNGTKVSIAALLSNDTDADSDTVTFVSATAGSANGTIVQSGNWIYYTPADGFTGADSFTYTINDGHGATVTGTVTVAIKVDTAASPNLVITDLGDGSYRVRMNGIPNRAYRLQYSESASPLNWQPLGTMTTDAFGLGEFIDTPSNGTPQRYYRSVHP